MQPLHTTKGKYYEAPRNDEMSRLEKVLRKIREKLMQQIMLTHSEEDRQALLERVIKIDKELSNQ